MRFAPGVWSASVFLALAVPAIAEPVASPAVGTTLTVRPGLIWFQDQDALSRWQKLKRAASVEDLADYEHQVLSQREAWQFTNPLDVKIVGYDAERGQANVEMLTPGRMQGTTWFLDTSALTR
jgi:hypothetical protein